MWQISMHVWKIILSIFNYEWGLGYNMYNEVPPVPKILHVYMFKLFAMEDCQINS
jgi:hypothetical protein